MVSAPLQSQPGHSRWARHGRKASERPPEGNLVPDVKIVGHIVWPITLLFVAGGFYRPLSNLITTLGRRITKLSAFKVKIELASLSLTSCATFW